MNIVIDIETCPAQDPAVIEELRANIDAQMKADIAALKPPGNIKDPAKIAAWLETERPAKEKAICDEAVAAAEDAHRKTSFDGALGHICVIGYSVNDGRATSMYSENWANDEEKLLRSFYLAIDDICREHPNERPTFIGHNLVDFDLRFMFQRSVVLGVKPSRYIPFAAKPWDDCVYDTMAKWGARAGGSLNKITKALGLGGKGDIDGSMVWDYVRAGRIAEVAKYCENDVNLTRALYKRMTFQ